VKLDLPAAIANLKRQSEPSRVFFFEHGEEPLVKQALCDAFDLCVGLNENEAHFRLRREMRIKQCLGQEFMRVFPAGIRWQGLPQSMTSVPPSIGPIQTWEDFERYPWPRIEQVDFFDIEWLNEHLEDNLTLWSMTYLFQQVSNLVGFEPLCMMLFDNRELVQAIVEKVGQFYLDLTRTLCEYERLGAINIGDDLGHKTSLLLRPTDLRELFFPWHRRIIQEAKSRSRLGLFHCCGQVEMIMPDLIDTVGIDAKHSTQDLIEPITVSKQRWGSRVALLGGVDVDFITRGHPQRIADYSRNILDHCLVGGGFAFGVGNWVADSIPLENYLAMLAAARAYA
jgi:uroporphyrinogen decarboxylase